MMSQAIALEIVVIFFLVVLNGVFAMSEIAVVAARKPRLQQMAGRGSRRAATALQLADNPERFLSTVQIGITLVGVFAGAFGGATLADQIDQYLEGIPALAPYSEAIGVGSVVLGITYLSLIVGELVPKRLALNAPERIAAAVAPAMHRLSRIAAPAVHLLSVSTRLVLRLLRVQPGVDRGVTPEEVTILLRQGAEAGTIAREEREIVERAFRLADRSVRAVMTPRVDVEWIDLSRTLEDIRRVVRTSLHHRFPVAAGRLDQLRGVIGVSDVWREEIASTAALTEYVRPPLTVPRTTSALSMLERFRQTRNHLAVVLDEYGGVEGIVTPTDILEALVGELPEAGETHEPPFLQRQDGSWSVDASAGLDEVQAVVGIPSLPDQKDEYQTLAGYLIGRAGRLPRLGETITVGGYRFEIMDMDGRRIDRIVVSKSENARP